MKTHYSLIAAFLFIITTHNVSAMNEQPQTIDNSRIEYLIKRFNKHTSQPRKSSQRTPLEMHYYLLGLLQHSQFKPKISKPAPKKKQYSIHRWFNYTNTKYSKAMIRREEKPTKITQ